MIHTDSILLFGEHRGKVRTRLTYVRNKPGCRQVSIEFGHRPFVGARQILSPRLASRNRHSALCGGLVNALCIEIMALRLLAQCLIQYVVEH